MDKNLPQETTYELITTEDTTEEVETQYEN